MQHKRSYKPRTKILTNKNGTQITNEKQIVNEFIDFFEKLPNKSHLNNENEEIKYHTVELEIVEPAQNEIYWTFDGLKNNKTPVNDGVIT